MYDIQKIKKDLQSILSDFRYEHSLMVADEAKKLAHHYNYDEEKAYVAGLVHDIAKDFDEEENLKWINKYNLSGDIFLPEFKNIIHAEIGYFVVKEWYGFDEEICNAVRYHTIGNVPMSFLEKIVFIADKIARKNTNPIIDKEKLLAYENIDKSIVYFLRNQKDRLENNGFRMYPTSLKLLEELEKKIKT